jgi:hypothetical protein
MGHIKANLLVAAYGYGWVEVGDEQDIQWNHE